jgi:hypothetical protein
MRLSADRSGDSSSLDVVVKAFARVDGLGSNLTREGRISDVTQLRAFCAGFSSRLPLFDFIDVGPGKERADNKIRGTEQPGHRRLREDNC